MTASAKEALWEQQNQEWRSPSQVVSLWKQASDVDSRLLQYNVSGQWWDVVEACGLTLFITREYEHLVMAIQHSTQGPSLSFFPIPHPSGIAVDPSNDLLHIASTRNPNQIFDFVPITQTLPRNDSLPLEKAVLDLVPVGTRIYPGCLYMHDLAFIGENLYANAVGENSVIRLGKYGCYERVWWPQCIDSSTTDLFDRNYLQLNSIAAGNDIEHSFFSASVEKPSFRRPGHKNFPVNQRGVIFSGATRMPIVTGLTRPHSARLHQSQLWVDNSGYGELGKASQGRLEVVAQLPGWTRGLFFHENLAFVGTSRVLKRFRQYAPGLQVEHSVCGIHAVDIQSGSILGSLTWPYGNQIFAIEGLSNQKTSGFPFRIGKKGRTNYEKNLFYAFQSPLVKEYS